jgi:hypothetical protein
MNTKTQSIKQGGRGKSAVSMTVEEFAIHLILMWDDLIYFEQSKPSRTDRSYMNQKRGNFFGSGH